MSPMEETFQKINTGSNRVKLMKAALFEDDDEELMEVEGPPNVDITKIGQPRQVVLESRPTVLERRDKLIEDIASSMLGGNTSRGLGGLNESTAANHSMTSSLLKSQYLSMVASMKATPSQPIVPLVTSAKKSSKKLPR